MKVNRAIVKLVLRTNKTLKDGTHPIMLRVSFNGIKEKASGISCKKNEWDSKNQMVKKSVRNSSLINSNLRTLLRYYEDARDALDAKGMPYTASTVINSGIKDTNNDSYLLLDVFKRYASDRMLATSTIINRTSFLNEINRFFGHHLDIRELDNEAMNAFISAKEKEGKSSGYLRLVVSTIMAMQRWLGVENVDPRLKKRLPEARKVGYVHRRSIEYIKEYFLDNVVDRSDGGWSYKDDGLESILDRNSKLFPLYLFLFIYLMQGLSPIDCALLKISDVRSIIVDGRHYWAIDLHRRKTKVAVKIRIMQDGVFNLVMMKTLLMFRRGLLLPLLDGIDVQDEKKLTYALGGRLKRFRPKLKDELEKVNDIIVRHNVESNDNVPLIDIASVNFYTARHSYAQAYLSTPNASPIALATLLGRSVNTLGVYLKELTEESDIIAAADVLG